jgi:hypothetical protein
MPRIFGKRGRSGRSSLQTPDSGMQREHVLIGLSEPIVQRSRPAVANFSITHFRKGPHDAWHRHKASYSSSIARAEEINMRISKSEIPVRINAPGAVARQQLNFGDSTGFGMISGEYFSLGKGADIAPLLQGLEGDLCQAPHWGYVLQGELTVTYADGSFEVINGGDLFHWPPGHTVKVGEDAEIILFSPQHEHSQVIDHMLRKMAG